ncbi:calmodulin-binding transcription activator 4-like isoform X2 [Lotus japonicus]|uniref:calmodulin-binding transcription activator 4-like isoform X2 n=1 Tax=Lotus japonicus TaxID=34305 RepID=UPI00258E9255|nr:calmodulin-binding transcription activator 4-like isoform X2 [Lotus japonicus]
MPPGLEYNISELYEEAKKRWLKPVEVLYILRNHNECEFTNVPPHQPTGGSLFLFNRRVLRFFRKDGHNWRKKRDGKTVGEAHERLKVGNVEILNCYYAHGEENRTFQRRSYWMLDPEYEHIVLVHYRDINEAKPNSGPARQSSPGSSSVFSQTGSSYTTQNPGTASMLGDDSCEPKLNFSSLGSLDVTSDMVTGNIIMSHLDETDAKVLRQLEEQLSLNEDSFKEFSPLYSKDEVPHDLTPCQDQILVYKEDISSAFSRPDDHKEHYDGYNGRQDDSRNDYHALLDHDCPDGHEKSLSWTEMLESCKPSSVIKLPEQHPYEAFENEKLLSSSRREIIANQESSHWLISNSNNAEKNFAFSFPQDIGGVTSPLYSLEETQGTNSDYYTTFFDQIQIQEPLGTDSSLIVSEKQKFTIREVSPEYCYATETTKVIIIGSFLLPSSDSRWGCMFGDIEVPVEIIQDGVISCETPPHPLGKVTLCITSGNREPCSEVREFEFRNRTNSCARCDSLETVATRSPEELLLLVRFAQMLLSPTTAKHDIIESGSHLPTKQEADDDSWSHIIDTLLVGSGTSSGTIDWLLEELLKDKLQLWLSYRSHERDEGTGCFLSKKEQGIIHMVSGLGFEWALSPILSCGVNVNFRDINGWTALHWAARFGREKVVASLIASGASAGAVTDPNSQDPTGKTAASIAACNGHKGLAGYLSEVDLTSHLSSLTLEERDIAKGFSEFAAELTSHLSKENLEVSEDQVSVANTLDAVRNAALAAARIQAAFRAHSFRKRKEREVVAAMASSSLDGYGISAGGIDDNIPALAALSKFGIRSLRDYAALSIQKKYRGWKGRKEFLALRQKVVKIQAHVRGYQVRKQYKIIIWAVGILDKVVLRWRRKRVGLRSSQKETETNEESDDEDFLKVFRKEKVNVAVEKALKRVLSMVHSTRARQQYSRLLEMYRQAKAELGSTSDETLLSTTSVEDAFNIEDDDLFQFPWEAL